MSEMPATHKIIVAYLALAAALIGACGNDGETPADTGKATSAASEHPTEASGDGSTSAGSTSDGSTSAGSTSDGSTSDGSASDGSGATSEATVASSTSTAETTGASTTGDEETSATTSSLECSPFEICEPLYLVDSEGYMTDAPSGWVRCTDPLNRPEVLRLEAVACAHEVFWPQCDGAGGDCEVDADCPNNQVCGDVWGSCRCVSPCMSDDDCLAGELCLCAAKSEYSGDGPTPEKNRCIPAGCASASDCGDGCDCRGSSGPCGAIEGAYCSTDSDECGNHDECEEQGGRCFWEPEVEHWSCGEWFNCE